MIRHCKERTPAESRGKVKNMEKYYYVTLVAKYVETVILKTADKNAAITRARHEQHCIERDKSRETVEIRMYEEDIEDEECANFDYNILPFFEFDVTQELMNTISSYMDDEIREDLHSELAPCEPEVFLKRYVEIEPDFAEILETEFNIEL